MPSRARRIFRIFLGLILLAALALAYAFWIEPDWIQVTHHHVSAPLAAPIKIAHLSDLHTSGLGSRERSLLAILAEEKPDVVLITGDTLANDGTYDQAAELLRELKAPLGVWLVRGNWENWQRRTGEHAFYSSLGVRFLLNEGALLRPDVWLAGLDDPATGHPNPAAAFSGAPPEAYRILFFHAPAYFDQVAGQAPLILAGHTHGGQVRIPLFEPLWLPQDSGDYIEGWFEQNGSRLYVSRGVGTSILPARFLCRPEVAIIHVGP